MTDPRTAGAYLVEQVRTALAHDPRTNILGVTVTIVERTIFLRGTVASDARRDCATLVVRELLPAYDVQNDVSVDDPATASAPERVP